MTTHSNELAYVLGELLYSKLVEAHRACGAAQKLVEAEVSITGDPFDIGDYYDALRVRSSAYVELVTVVAEVLDNAG